MVISTKNKLDFARQGGFSLIELMIAIPLGLLVLFSILKIFTTSVQGVYLQNDFSRVQENGRMSMELLSRDIRGADYWGCLRDTSLIANHLDDINDTDYDATLVPTNQDGVAGVDTVSALTLSTIQVKDGTDTLTLRGAKSFSDVKVVTPFMPTKSAVIQIINGSGIATGDIVMVSDCKGGDLFTNTHAVSTILGHQTGNVSIAGAVDNKTQELSHIYTSSAQILVPYVRTYFIGKNPAGSHSLYRSDNGIANELVRGVTDLQLEYGEDTTDNGAVDTFSVAPAVTDMDLVRSIRFTLVSKSGSSAAALEKNYKVTASIRNRTLQ